MEDNCVDPKEMNSLTLAYLGDAVIELHVRERLIKEGDVKPNRLHHRAVNFVSAKSQAEFLHYLVRTGLLTDFEMAVVRRGRNAKSATTPKNTDVQTYRYGTAFEALIGFLYLDNQEERAEALLNEMFRYKEILTDVGGGSGSHE